MQAWVMWNTELYTYFYRAANNIWQKSQELPNRPSDKKPHLE